MSTMIDPTPKSLPLGLRPATVEFGRSKGRQTSKILTDGTKFYCAEGDYEADTFNAVFGHRSHHSASVGTPARLRSASLDTLRAEVKGLLTRIDQIEEAQNSKPKPQTGTDWEARARAAERQLATLKRAFGTLA